MKKASLCLAIITIFLINRVQAKSIETLKSQTDLYKVNTFSMGSVWYKSGDKQTFYLNTNDKNSYLPNKTRNSTIIGEIFIGSERKLSNNFQTQLGLAVVSTGNIKLDGDIWADAESKFDNHSYKYKINHKHLAVKGKLLADKNYPLIPWVSASVGVGFNKAYSFENTPKIFEALPYNNFSSNTKMGLSWSAGLGLQRNLNKNWQTGLSYEFADLGKSKLHRASGQTLNSGLYLKNLYTHNVLFNLTYITKG